MDDQGATVLYVLLVSCILRIRVSIENCHCNINKLLHQTTLRGAFNGVQKKYFDFFLIIIKHRCIYKQIIDIKWVYLVTYRGGHH